jgi:hypothetical protein
VCDRPRPAFDRIRDALIAADPRRARTPPRPADRRMLRDAGLRDVQVRTRSRLTHPGEYYHGFLLTLAGLLREPLLAGGGATAWRLDAECSALRAHLDRPHTITCMPLLWQAWGTKP